MRPVASPSSSPPPVRRRIAVRLLAVAFALLAALGLAEAGLAWWTARATPALYQLDARLGWTHAAGIERRLDVEGGGKALFRTDARGLRATPHAEPRQPGSRRFLFVGDSFTEGSQVDDDQLFSRRLERALPGVECWNAAVGGYSTLQTLLALPEQLAAWRPDVVVLQVYDNDLKDNLMPYFAGLGPRPYARVVDGAVRVEPRAPAGAFERFLMPAPGSLWLYEHSALYRSLHKNLWLPAKWRELEALELSEREATPAADRRAVMRKLLGDVAAAVRAQGGALVVAAVPTREEAKAGASELQGWLADECARLGAPFVSTLPLLAREDVAATYFAKDIHLTARGHEVVAEALLPTLREALR